MDAEGADWNGIIVVKKGLKGRKYFLAVFVKFRVRKGDWGTRIYGHHERVVGMKGK
jgi:hypothetical protein